MIRIKAQSLSGSVHWVVGGVRNRESYRWQTTDEAFNHLNRVGWKIIETQICGRKSK